MKKVQSAAFVFLTLLRFPDGTETICTTTTDAPVTGTVLLYADSVLVNVDECKADRIFKGDFDAPAN